MATAAVRIERSRAADAIPAERPEAEPRLPVVAILAPTGQDARVARKVLERLAREALPHVQKTDSLQFQGDAYRDLGEVLEAAGRRDEAIATWQEALDRYERKGIVPLARRVRERLATLEPA